ncbi:MAG: formimidoylglutamate deiminase, partial [Proteobacteria bacterium]|nr:formimidoylglutamate deiminase [Pseudomonadota bacterium]
VAGGARALGLGAAGLVPGAPADIVLLDTQRVEFAGVPAEALVDAWVFAPRPAPLAAVWVGGELLVSDGRHRAREGVERAYRAALARLTGAAGR